MIVNAFLIYAQILMLIK